MTSALHPSLYLAIDFGISHLNVAIGDATGRPLSSIRSQIEFFRPEGAPDTALEFDPEITLRLVYSTIRAAITAADITPGDISGIGVTSQPQGIVLLNLEGRPIYAGPSHDRRAVAEGIDIDANALIDVWELTGHGPGSRTGWSRLKWFATHKPDIYDRTRTLCSIADWITLELTGELLMEETLAVDAGLGLVISGDPANALAPAFNLGDIQLPATCHPGTVVGNLKSKIANSIGLRPNTPIVACGPNVQSGLIGLGVHLPGAVGIVSGSGTTCQLVTERPVFDDTRAMSTGRHVVRNRWVVDSDSGETGSIYHWLLSLLYGSLDMQDIMDGIDEPLGNIKPGKSKVVAFLGPSLVHTANEIQRTGGFLFPVGATDGQPDRFNIARSALDSFAFAIRHSVDRLSSMNGPALSISVGGGMTKTRTFRTILANVLDREIGIAESGDATLLGALSQVAASVGRGPSLAELALTRAAELTKYEPAPAQSAIYENLYSEWRHKERMLRNLDI